MMGKVRTLFLILLFSALLGNFAHADESSVTYLVWLDSFTTTQIDDMKGYGYAKNDQPVKITDFLPAPNTNYAHLIITLTENKEKNVVAGFLSQGCLQPLSTLYIKGAYDRRIGGNVTWVETEDCRSAPAKYVCLPADWAHDWTVVKISSP